MKMAVQTSPVARLENAMRSTPSHFCEEVSRMMDEYGAKDLQNLLGRVIDFIFELNVQPVWSLRTLTKQLSLRDYESVRQLLSPRGPVVNLCYKLLADSSVKYEFPLIYIPAAVRQLLEEGVVPAFYVGKLQYHPQIRVPSSLLLNSFEYYMMHFFHYLINPNLQKYATCSAGSDSLYLNILEEYLVFFLPFDGTEQSLVPIPISPFHTGSSLYSTPPKPRYETPRANLTPLLKKSALTMMSGATGSTSLSAERCSHQDSWRAMLLLQAMNELWLSHVANREDSHLRAGSPSRAPVNMLQITVFIPSVDHLRAVRKLVKHLHYFSNSVGPHIITGLDELKRTVWTYFKKKLYIFLRHTLEHWPLDASFRLFLETWLSYIQPWRYISSSSNNKVDAGDKVVDLKWQTFIAENLLFFTFFMQKVMLRFLRVELSSSKTSLMLYRISKVYSQGNLKAMISSAEGSLETSTKYESSSYLSVSVRQHINDLESTSFSYPPLFGQECVLAVRNLLSAAAHAKTRLRRSQAEQSHQKSVTIWSRIRDWFLVTPVQSDDNGAELAKALNHLEVSSAQLATFFDVELPQEPELHSTPPELAELAGSSSLVQTPVRSRNDTTTMTNRVHSPQRRFDMTYRGNPDTQPIRTYEVAFLVRTLHQISTNINDKFAHELQQLYGRRDLVGRMGRQLLAAPTNYEEVVRTYGTPKIIDKSLPPRISLRLLANKQLLGYTMGLFMLSYALGWAPELVLLLALGTGIFVLFTRASLDVWNECDLSVGNEDSFAARY